MTLHDLDTRIRKLEDFHALFSSKNWDMRQKRMVNAHPSVDPYDYVVRKELLQATEVTPANPVADHYTIVFCSVGTIAAGNNVCAPFIVQQQGSPVLVTVAAIIPPSTTDAAFRLKYDGSEILSSNLILPAGTASLTVIPATNLAGAFLFAAQKCVTIDVIDTGSPAAVKVNVSILVKKTQ